MPLAEVSDTPGFNVYPSSSAALTTLSALSGAWCVRVHDVARSADAVRVAARFGAEAGP